MFERVESFVGKDNLNNFKNNTVLIVGLGGVGGYALEALVRTGIESFILIDYDKIDITNLNRQIISNKNNIGKYKVEIAKERVLSINDKCNVITYNEFLNKDTISILNNNHIDYIIDACDSIEAKKLLIDYSLEKDIPLIACMGTARKIDPTKLEITDIRKTSYDPLAKILRKYVNDKKINKKIMVVSSKEQPIHSTKLPSLVFVPATAGLLCSKYVIESIIRKGK